MSRPRKSKSARSAIRFKPIIDRLMVLNAPVEEPPAFGLSLGTFHHRMSEALFWLSQYDFDAESYLKWKARIQFRKTSTGLFVHYLVQENPEDPSWRRKLKAWLTDKQAGAMLRIEQTLEEADKEFINSLQQEYSFDYNSGETQTVFVRD